MKFLFDFFPVLLFFAVFKVAGIYPDTAQAIAQNLLGGMVSNGGIDAKQAPALLATVVAMIATVFQIGYLLFRGKKVDGMLWISGFIILFFGGLAIYFNDQRFIKWKPTMIFWCSSIMFAICQLFFKKNLIREMMEAQFALPELVWARLVWTWVGFFAALGLINLVFAFVIFKTTDQFGSWLNFKTFGMPIIMFIFVVSQGLMLAKYMKEEEEPQ